MRIKPGMKVRLKMPEPNPKQDKALRATKRYIGYGGARGGGKSWFVRWKATLLCLKFPGIKILITRKTYKELENNHINPLKAMLNGVAKYNKSEKMFYFPNGSTISFGYCASDGDLDQYQGAEYDVWFADEAGQFKQEWLEKIDACVRGVNNFPKRTYYTLNPGGPSHSYFKRVFIDRAFEEDEDPEDYEFIQALLTDNTALEKSQPKYRKSLEKLPPKLRAAWLYGAWDVYEGQFFEDFRQEPDGEGCKKAGISREEAKALGLWTHVIEPFDLNSGDKKGWPVYRSYDFGYGKPFSCAWWAVDYDGRIYRILELYGCTETPNEGVKWTPDRQFQEIARIERDHPWLRGRDIQGVADPACWDASRGASVAETASKYGIYFTPGDHKRISGWMQCHYRLAFDEQGVPMMYVFSNCKAFIRTIPQMMYSQTHPEDLDTTMEDHVADEWRYFCMSRPISPVAEAKKTMKFYDPLDQFSDI